jgi:hypothetical protein
MKDDYLPIPNKWSDEIPRKYFYHFRYMEL